jgi:hypothetical protein
MRVGAPRLTWVTPFGAALLGSVDGERNLIGQDT